MDVNSLTAASPPLETIPFPGAVSRPAVPDPSATHRDRPPGKPLAWDRYVNLSHGADWRMRFACMLAGGQSPPYRDSCIRAAARYLADERTNIGSRQREGQWGAIADAIELERNPIMSEWAHLMILADMPRAEVALTLGVSQPGIRSWERLFLELRGRRRADLWVLAVVIWPVELRGDLQQGLQMRRAYYGGPDAVRAMLELEKPIEPTAPPADRLDRALAKLYAQADVAAEYCMHSVQGRQQIMDAAVRLSIAAPQIQLAVAQRDYLARCGERRDRELQELRQQLEAAQRELAHLRQAAAAAASASTPTASRPGELAPTAA